MTDRTDPAPSDPETRQALAQLQAEVTALQVWRAHQSDVLDGILNGQPAPDGASDRDQDSGTFLSGLGFGAGPADPSYTDDIDDEALEALDGLDGGGTGAAAPDPTTVTNELIEWVHQHVCAVIARPLRGELRWCPRWWEHPEAVLRLTALRRAWTELAGEPGAALSVYLRDHLDPCLRELTHPLGPFADCSHNQRHTHQPPGRHDSPASSGRGARTPDHTPVPTLPILDPPPAALDTASASGGADSSSRGRRR